MFFTENKSNKQKKSQFLYFFLIFFAKHDEFTPFLFKFAPKYVYRFQTNGCILFVKDGEWFNCFLYHFS